MSVVATLNDTPIQVLRNDFLSFNQKSGWNYAEHSRLEGKPRLQQVGGVLRTLRFNFLFHRSLVDVEEALNELKDLANEQKPISFVFGESYEGQWVIDSLEETPVKVTVSGDSVRLDIVEFTISMTEWVETAFTTEESENFGDQFEFRSA